MSLPTPSDHHQKRFQSLTRGTSPKLKYFNSENDLIRRVATKGLSSKLGFNWRGQPAQIQRGILYFF
jgi:hypothetical protein